MLAGLQARWLPCVPLWWGFGLSPILGMAFSKKDESGLYASGQSHARQRTVWLSRRFVWQDLAGKNPCKASRQRKIRKPWSAALPASATPARPLGLRDRRAASPIFGSAVNSPQ